MKNYQLTPLTDNPGSTYSTLGIDGSFWSIANDSLYWFDGCEWEMFATFTGGVTSVAIRELNNIWAIRKSDANIYHFNGIVWAPQSLPEGGGQCLSIGFDDRVWCLDNNPAKPQIWWFDSSSDQWIKFGELSNSDPTFLQISSGCIGGTPFLVAIDTDDNEWQCTNHQGTWELLPNVTQGHGKYIAAGPDQSIFVADNVEGQLWTWKSGDANWILLNDQTGFTQISVDSEERFVAVDSNSMIYAGLKFSPDQKGFRGSDWDNAGTTLYAVKYVQKAGCDEGCDEIYRSTDRGLTLKKCGELPAVTDGTVYYWYALPLMIPTRFNDDTEKMLVSPIGSQKLYLCDDINQDCLAFHCVLTDDAGSAGIFNGFAEDSDGNVYAGWYAINANENKAILYKSTRDVGYRVWQAIASWHARHIHTVRVNPFNGYLYVILGEPNFLGGLPSPDSMDAGKIMRSKDGGHTWDCVTDTWSNTPVVPSAGNPAFYLGLYFSTLGFINDRVVVGEDTDFKQGRIFYFDDDVTKPLPFVPQLSYTTCNKGEFFLGAVSMGKKLYFASQFLAPTPGVTSTRCISTNDGINWKLEQLCYNPGSSSANANFGVFTYHPERGRRLMYSLSSNDSFFIDQI